MGAPLERSRGDQNAGSFYHRVLEGNGMAGFWLHATGDNYRLLGGLLPGIGGLSTLALMLPFSYSIKDPISAFAFLLGMLAVTGTTGDLTSILFGIPGEGSSAALIL